MSYILWTTNRGTCKFLMHPAGIRMRHIVSQQKMVTSSCLKGYQGKFISPNQYSSMCLALPGAALDCYEDGLVSISILCKASCLDLKWNFFFFFSMALYTASRLICEERQEVSHDSVSLCRQDSRKVVFLQHGMLDSSLG